MSTVVGRPRTILYEWKCEQTPDHQRQLTIAMHQMTLLNCAK
jgi:hypothetical protein